MHLKGSIVCLTAGGTFFLNNCVSHMPTSLRGVVKLYGLYPIISPERGHKVYNTLKLRLSKLPQCVMRKGTLYSLSVKVSEDIPCTGYSINR